MTRRTGLAEAIVVWKLCASSENCAHHKEHRAYERKGRFLIWSFSSFPVRGGGSPAGGQLRAQQRRLFE
eukprot:scaffold107804_cov19-Prasinocladus_malaysianus.AAC.2